MAFFISTNWVIGLLLEVFIVNPGFKKSMFSPDLSRVKHFHIDFETLEYSGKNVERRISAEGETTTGPEIKSWFTEKENKNKGF